MNVVHTAATKQTDWQQNVEVRYLLELVTHTEDNIFSRKKEEKYNQGWVVWKETQFVGKHYLKHSHYAE